MRNWRQWPLFSGTVERHISPARYRFEKVAHVVVLACLGLLAGVSPVTAFLLSGYLYWSGGVVLTLWRRQALRGKDKLRDYALCLLPFTVVAHNWGLFALGLAINLILLRESD